MDIELKEIRDFLISIPPFDRLPMAKVDILTNEIAIRYIRRGAPLPPLNVRQNRLYILRKGAITLLSLKGKLLGKLSDGDICSIFCMDNDNEKFKINVEEDTLVYTIPCDKLYEIIGDNETVAAFVKKTASQRLNDAVSTMMDKSAVTSVLMHTFVKDLMHYPVLSVEKGASIYDAAVSMTEGRVSSLIVMDGETPVGIITDKDITRRCVAAQLSPNEPVDKVMTTNMLYVPSQTNGYDALMMMTRKHIHHLPVIDENKLSGIITITDLMRQEGRNSVYLTSAIRKADSVEALKQHSLAIPHLQVQLVRMGATADHVGKSVTAITSAITRRLIEMAEEKLGPAPVPYVWVAAGSQARREQTSHSDQDNGLIISNDMKPEDKPWFEALAKFVSDGLNECGYIYCPGDVMATNPLWCQTVDVWEKYFHDWIMEPSPKALMYSSIFFDLRAIYGEKDLLRNIRKEMLKKTQQSTLFLAHLTGNAMKLKPPLGFFRDFVLVHDGEHDDTLDLKHNGIAPIVDLARIYALAEGVSAVNTMERLQKVAGTPSLSEEGAANLLDALTFIGTLRIKHQADQIKRGDEADNFMSPKEISKLEREHLKDAFKVIQTMQSSLERKF